MRASSLMLVIIAVTVFPVLHEVAFAHPEKHMSWAANLHYKRFEIA